MSDQEEIIRRAWDAVSLEQRQQLRSRSVVYVPEPINRNVVIRSKDALPDNEDCNHIMFARGPFGTVVGYWQGTSVLVVGGTK